MTIVRNEDSNVQSWRQRYDEHKSSEHIYHFALQHPKAGIEGCFRMTGYLALAAS